MSWDLSSEEIICNKLESQQTVIFAFSKKIKELEAKNAEFEKKLEIARKALEFYGKEGNWDDRILLILDDTEDTAWSSYNGGKRAREALSKIKSGGL